MAAVDERMQVAEPRPVPGRARSAALISIGILASRLVGLVRQRAIGHYLGTGDTADALAAAFRVGNVIQNLLGEGTLSATIVPIYAKARQGSAEVAGRFARTALGWLIAGVTVLVALGVLFAPTLAALLAPGFEGDKRALMATLVRVLFPMTGLLVISAWALGVLSAHRRFLLPYAAPTLWSIAQIAAIVIAANLLGWRDAGLAYAVAWGALAGAALQLLVMLPTTQSLLGSLVPSFDRGVPGVREAAARFPGALLGRGVIQLSGLIDTYLVSFLGSGAVACFGFAQTAYLLPMALLGTGEAAAALPDLAERDLDAPETKRSMTKSLGASLTRVFALAVGASAFFAVMGHEVVTLLFRGGLFDQSSTDEVAAILTVYAIGLPANAASRIFSTACFALGDTKRPARFAAVRVVVSTALSLVAMQRFGVPGVVLGAVLAGWVEFALLANQVRNTLGGTGLAEVPFGKVALLGIAPAAVGFGVSRGLGALLLNPFLAAAIVLTLAGLAFLAAAALTRVINLQRLLRR